ncbi:hypothetical protein BKA70DRAFT_1432346 [Coprinopsis sp. MPI-PUGE-AT-0042]|nr:hypothetical protein BKA70DRAFT_1432346 [Coprinopsis sp. MPI-PUGE-AT-0042]
MDSWDLERFNPPRSEEDMSRDGERGVTAENRSRRTARGGDLSFPSWSNSMSDWPKRTNSNDGDLLAFLRPRVQRYKNEYLSFQNHQLARLFSVQVTFVSEQSIDIMEELQEMEDVDLDGVDIDIEYDGDERKKAGKFKEFRNDKEADEQFTDEKRFLIVQIQNL